MQEAEGRRIKGDPHRRTFREPRILPNQLRRRGVLIERSDRGPLLPASSRAQTGETLRRIAISSHTACYPTILFSDTIHSSGVFLSAFALNDIHLDSVKLVGDLG